MKRRLISLLLVALLMVSILPVAAFAENPAKNITVKGAYNNGKLSSVTVDFNWKMGFAQATGAKATLQRAQMVGQTTDNADMVDFSDEGNYAKGTKSPAGLFLKEATVKSDGGNGVVDSAYDHSVTMDGIDTLAAGRYFVYLWVTYLGAFYPDCLLCVIDVPESGTASYIPADTSGDLRNVFSEAQKQQIEDKTNPTPIHIPVWTSVPAGKGSKDAATTVTCTADNCGAATKISLTASDVTLPGNVFNAVINVEELSAGNANLGRAVHSHVTVSQTPGYKYSPDGTNYTAIDPSNFEAKQGYYQASILVMDGNTQVENLFVNYVATNPVVTAATGDNRPIEMMFAGMVTFAAIAAVAFILDSKRKARF